MNLFEVIREKYGLLVESYMIKPQRWYETPITQINFRFIKMIGIERCYIELDMDIPEEEIENPTSIINRLDKIFAKESE